MYGKPLDSLINVDVRLFSQRHNNTLSSTARLRNPNFQNLPSLLNGERKELACTGAMIRAITWSGTRRGNRWTHRRQAHPQVGKPVANGRISHSTVVWDDGTAGGYRMILVIHPLLACWLRQLTFESAILSSLSLCSALLWPHRLNIR